MSAVGDGVSAAALVVAVLGLVATQGWFRVSASLRYVGTELWWGSGVVTAVTASVQVCLLTSAGPRTLAVAAVLVSGLSLRFPPGRPRASARRVHRRRAVPRDDGWLWLRATAAALSLVLQVAAVFAFHTSS